MKEIIFCDYYPVSGTYRVYSCSCVAWSPALTPSAGAPRSRMLRSHPEWRSGGLTG